VTPELARGLHLPRPEGVLVKDVTADGPAAAAGVRNGDVILSVNGRDLASPEELRFRIATLDSHARIQLAVWRAGTRRELSVTLTPPPEIPAREVTVMDGRQPFAGATVANLNPAFDEELGLDDSATGVIVRKVQPGTYAEQVGLAVGDIVIGVNDDEIDSVRSLRRAVRAPSPWRITIERHGRRLAITIGN